ncbi:long-chain fatty acid--CoA ligase [Kineosporia sp. J2-2]|uniref:Long-chain fatty acid--CoA ligase n=1 Tax=Kineosporia corallincola TaxID=2835133 RepID=A0ABS5TSQ7_9ACTN|nr:long-chain fatty acid--CoA ligase [Kineosporia corallincola]MBT0773822.1 long-chain fatty acid--CoA ligase [Kineosporia corallincola]
MRSTMQNVPLLTSRLIEYAGTVYPGSEVVTWGAGGPRRSSFADVARDCRRLANALRSLGVDGDQRVGSFMWNNEEHLELYLGVPAAGAVLHTINIRLFPQQMVYVVNHAEDRVVFVDNSLAQPFSALLEHTPLVEHVVVNGPVPDEVRQALGGDGRRQVHDYRALLDAQPDTFDWPVLDENDGALMCYTSGTTGNPKGVVYSHRSNLLHATFCAGSNSLGLSQASRALAVVPLFHANAWGLAYASMISGASVIMPDRFLQPEPLVAMIASERVTCGGAVPTLMTGVLDHLDAHPEIDVSSLNNVIIGGSACPPALMHAFHDRHGITILHGWGMTETSPLGTVAIPPIGAEGEEYWEYRHSQGRLALHVEARLIGADGTRQPWDGESVGEVEVRGPWITGSYFREDDPATQEKFDDGWLRTGDIGSLTPDGYLTISDRAKDVIKSGGEWISSIDLENTLMGHPGVQEASVVGVPDDKWGERPLAVVVPAEGQQPDVTELRDYLETRVAHWQVPERWAFVTEVPKTSVGKFDKKVLRARYAEGALTVLLPEKAERTLS